MEQRACFLDINMHHLIGDAAPVLDCALCSCSLLLFGLLLHADRFWWCRAGVFLSVAQLILSVVWRRRSIVERLRYACTAYEHGAALAVAQIDGSVHPQRPQWYLVPVGLALWHCYGALAALHHTAGHLDSESWVATARLAAFLFLTAGSLLHPAVLMIARKFDNWQWLLLLSTYSMLYVSPTHGAAPQHLTSAEAMVRGGIFVCAFGSCELLRLVIDHWFWLNAVCVSGTFSAETLQLLCEQHGTAMPTGMHETFECSTTLNGDSILSLRAFLLPVFSFNLSLLRSVWILVAPNNASALAHAAILIAANALAALFWSTETIKAARKSFSDRAKSPTQAQQFPPPLPSPPPPRALPPPQVSLKAVFMATPPPPPPQPQKTVSFPPPPPHVALAATSTTPPNNSPTTEIRRAQEEKKNSAVTPPNDFLFRLYQESAAKKKNQLSQPP